METRGQSPLSAFLDRTANLLLHLHDGCNLRCSHCYLDASSEATQSLTLALVLRTMDEAHHLGIKSVQLTGGEPLLYPNIEEVLSHCPDMDFKVLISTNGTCLTPAHVNLLQSADAEVLTSVDGPPEYHDRFRGRRRAFSLTTEAITNLVKHDVPVKVVATISEANFDTIDWLCAWAREQGVVEIQFQPLELVGRGRQLGNAVLNHERLCDLFLKLNDLSVIYKNSNLKITMTYKSRDQMLQHPCMAFVCNGKKCHRGIDKELKSIVVRENGDLLPEIVDIEPRFAIGNLYSGSLQSNLNTYLTDGYERFDRLCRRVYEKVVPNYPSPLIPWDEILAAASRTISEDELNENQTRQPDTELPAAALKSARRIL